jgi:hypothetical protein
MLERGSKTVPDLATQEVFGTSLQNSSPPFHDHPELMLHNVYLGVVLSKSHSDCKLACLRTNLPSAAKDNRCRPNVLQARGGEVNPFAPVS